MKSTSNEELVETTLRDLIGGGADALLAVVKSQMNEQQPMQQPTIIPKTNDETAIVPPQEDVVIGRAKENTAKQPITKAFVEEYEPPVAAGQELKGKLVTINYGDNSKASPQAAWTLGQLFDTSNLILLTRKGSNFYRQARDKYTVCVLGDENQKNSKADERVVPSGDETKLAQAIENLVSENPASTILLDNATELIFTLGFGVFSLLRRLAGVVSTYEDSSMVVLINKKAHESRMIEAVSNISNTFID